jgi:hypothetical protein
VEAILQVPADSGIERLLVIVGHLALRHERQLITWNCRQLKPATGSGQLEPFPFPIESERGLIFLF